MSWNCWQGTEGQRGEYWHCAVALHAPSTSGGDGEADGGGGDGEMDDGGGDVGDADGGGGVGGGRRGGEETLWHVFWTCRDGSHFVGTCGSLAASRDENF